MDGSLKVPKSQQSHIFIWAASSMLKPSAETRLTPGKANVPLLSFQTARYSKTDLSLSRQLKINFQSLNSHRAVHQWENKVFKRTWNDLPCEHKIDIPIWSKVAECTSSPDACPPPWVSNDRWDTHQASTHPLRLLRGLSYVSCTLSSIIPVII